MEQTKNEIDECSICLKPIFDTDRFTTKCGHIFHGSCILNWCKIRSESGISEQCPLCRGALKKTPNYSKITQEILYDFCRTLTSHNISLLSLTSLESNAMWLLLPSTCQDQLIQHLQYHYYFNEEENNNTVQERRLPYNFSLTDLSFPF